MIFGRPSFGAWTLYGLGSESQDLPGFVVFSTGRRVQAAEIQTGGSVSGPRLHQGVQFRSAGDPVLDLSDPRN